MVFKMTSATLNLFKLGGFGCNMTRKGCDKGFEIGHGRHRGNLTCLSSVPGRCENGGRRVELFLHEPLTQKVVPFQVRCTGALDFPRNQTLPLFQHWSLVGASGRFLRLGQI